MSEIAQHRALSRTSLWAGYALSGLVILFLLVDGGIKLVPLQVVIDTTVELGIPAHLARTLGVLTLVSTILYAIPERQCSARSF